MKRNREEESINSEPKRANSEAPQIIMNEQQVTDLMTRMSKQVADQITKDLSVQMNTFSTRLGAVEGVTRFQVPNPTPSSSNGDEISIIGETGTNRTTPVRG